MTLQDQLRLACDAGRNVLLIGLPGVGKTYQLHEFKKTKSENNEMEYQLCWCDIIKDNCIVPLIDSLPSDIVRPEKKEFENFAGLIRGRFSPNKRLVFILDQFNFSKTSPRFLEDLESVLKLQEEYGTNFSIIIAIRPGAFYAFDREEWDTLRPLLSCFSKIFVQPLSEDETKKLIEGENRSISSHTMQRLVYLSGGHPQLAKELLNLSKWKSFLALRFGIRIGIKSDVIVNIWEDLPSPARKWLCKFLQVVSPNTRISSSDTLSYFKELGLIKTKERNGSYLFSPLFKSYISKACGLGRGKLFRDALRKEWLFFVALAILYLSTGVILLEKLLALSWVFKGASLLFLVLASFYCLFIKGIYPHPGGGAGALQWLWFINSLLFLMIAIGLFLCGNFWSVWVAICAVFSFAVFVRFRLEYSAYG
mgnify:CR=1 FL=1